MTINTHFIFKVNPCVCSGAEPENTDTKAELVFFFFYSLFAPVFSSALRSHPFLRPLLFLLLLLTHLPFQFPAAKGKLQSFFLVCLMF